MISEKIFRYFAMEGCSLEGIAGVDPHVQGRGNLSGRQCHDHDPRRQRTDALQGIGKHWSIGPCSRQITLSTS